MSFIRSCTQNFSLSLSLSLSLSHTYIHSLLPKQNTHTHTHTPYYAPEGTQTLLKIPATKSVVPRPAAYFMSGIVVMVPKADPTPSMDRASTCVCVCVLDVCGCVGCGCVDVGEWVGKW
jgi:hypothetical protein